MTDPYRPESNVVPWHQRSAPQPFAQQWAYPQQRALVPPPPPIEPRYTQTAHVVHAVLSFFTFGLWLFIWVIVGVANTSYNGRLRATYERDYAAWQRAYWAWQHGG